MKPERRAKCFVQTVAVQSATMVISVGSVGKFFAMIVMATLSRADFLSHK
jgi:hypothetical protein